MVINQELLAAHLPDNAVGFCVALSGGIDSVVLLHVMHNYCQLKKLPLRAIHIHHGLQSEADQWVTFCQQLCHSMNISLDVHRGSVQVAGVSVEMAARNLRYEYFSKQLKPGHCLVLGHHEQDQVETCLLNLVKGAGPSGLAAMRVVKSFSVGWLCRPLLTVSVANISSYARHHQLRWVDDPSNGDVEYERNYIRHHILPMYTERWSAAVSSMSRSALLQQESVDFIDATFNESQDCLRADGTVNLAVLSHFNQLEQRLWIRRWLKRVNVMPSYEQLDILFNEVISAAMDRNPRQEFGHWVIMRSRHSLYCLRKESVDRDECVDVDVWTLNGAYSVDGVYLEPNFLLNTFSMLTASSQVKVMRRYQMIEQGHCSAKRFKSICHSKGVPVWSREKVVCISYDEKILQIVGFYSDN